MTKQIQKIWDRYLLHGALSGQTMNGVMIRFFYDYDDSYLSGRYDFLKMKRKMVELNLKRCLDLDQNKNPFCNFGNNPARNFIFVHSKTLAEALAKRKLTETDGILLKKYKWFKLLITRSRKNKAAKSNRHKNRLILRGSTIENFR